MKVLWITPNINQLGGVERVILGLSNFFVENGIYVTICSVFSQTTDLKFESDSRVCIEHKRRDYKNYKKTDWVLDIKSILKESDADIVIGSHEYVNMALVLNKKSFRGKIIVTQHITCDYYTRLHLWLNAVFYDRADAFLVLTDYDLRIYGKMGVKNCEVMPNAVFECPNYEKHTVNHEILAAGRLTKLKGFDILIRAFSIVYQQDPAWTLRILGSGEEKETLQALIDDLGLKEKVVLEGYQRDVLSYMKKADIFALPSAQEGFPIVLLEAMSCGVPVVSFDLPSTRDVLKSGGGLLVKKRNEMQLADALNQMMTSDELRGYLGEKGYAQSKNYSINAIGNRWIKLFDVLINTQRTRR